MALTTGDKIMVCGYENYGEGVVIEIKHYPEGYSIYFPNKHKNITFDSQDRFYQTFKGEKNVIWSLQDQSYQVLEQFKKRFENNPLVYVAEGDKDIEDKVGKIFYEIATSRLTPYILPNIPDMPKIIDYKYIEDAAVTIIKWADGTQTVVKAENPETADRYTGFVTAYAKKAAGNDNTINNLFDEWAIKKPKRETDAQIKANAEELENRRIAKKRKEKKEEYLTKKRAAEIAREYKARQLAHEKYGIPIDNGVKNID